MPKYLIMASYSPDGMKGLMAKGGTARADAIGKLAASVGGSLESMYFAFGGTDVFLVLDVPSHEAMVAVAGSATSSGSLSHCETVVLLTPAQLDDAAALTADYSPPGG